MEAPAAAPYPNLRNVYAPRQLQLADVPFLLFNISEPAAALTETNRLRLIRARRMAPVLFGKRLVPVAPFKNSLYGISHHRIRLHDPADIHRVVELFFRDTDLYFVGFCRGVVAEEGAEPQWGRVFIFDDLYEEAPAFLNAVKMGLYSDHNNQGDAPGPAAMVHLFETFYKFEDNIQIGHDDKGNPQAKGVVGSIEQAMETAIARTIILFAEALRLRSVYIAVLEALQSFDYFRSLPDRCWKLIRWWGQLSDDVQELRMNRRMALNTRLDERFLVVELSTLGQLIGRHGELTLCKLNTMMVISQELLPIVQSDMERLNFVDPMFQEEQQAQQQQQAQDVEGGGRGRGGRGRRGARGGRGRGEGGGRSGDAEIAAGGRGRGRKRQRKRRKRMVKIAQT